MRTPKKTAAATKPCANPGCEVEPASGWLGSTRAAGSVVPAASASCWPGPRVSRGTGGFVAVASLVLEAVGVVVGVSVLVAEAVGVAVTIPRNRGVAEGVAVGTSVLGTEVAAAGGTVAAGRGVLVTSGVTGRMVREGVGVMVGDGVDVIVDEGRGAEVFVGLGVAVGDGVLVGVGSQTVSAALATAPPLWTAKMKCVPGVSQLAGMRTSAEKDPSAATATGSWSSAPAVLSHVNVIVPRVGQSPPVTRTRKSCPATA